MSVQFGPQLIGMTEKSLNALLLRCLEGTGLTEPEWVTLRIAAKLDGVRSATDLAVAVRDQAHFPDAGALVDALCARGLLSDGRLSSAGNDMIASTQAKIADLSAPIWDALAAADVAATTRTLNEVLAQAQAILTSTTSST